MIEFLSIIPLLGMMVAFLTGVPLFFIGVGETVLNYVAIRISHFQWTKEHSLASHWEHQKQSHAAKYLFYMVELINFVILCLIAVLRTEFGYEVASAILTVLGNIIYTGFFKWA